MMNLLRRRAGASRDGGQGFACHLVAGECVTFVRAVDDGDDAAGEQLSVAQYIGPPARSEWILK
jgi:hypothetical protein